jgi:hypothetical protein
MKRIHTRRIELELSHDEWVALLAAAFYGANVLETDAELPGVAGAVDRLVDRLKARLRIMNLLEAAEELEEADDEISEPPGWSNSRLTPSA